MPSTTPSVAEPAAPLPVFVSESGRRARALRLAAKVAGGLTALWVVALLAGVLGLGRFPGLPLPSVAGSRHADTTETSGGARETARPGTPATVPVLGRPAVTAAPASILSPTKATPGRAVKPARVRAATPANVVAAPTATAAPATAKTAHPTPAPRPAKTPPPTSNRPATRPTPEPQGNGTPPEHKTPPGKASSVLR